jgi:hypothetical protein
MRHELFICDCGDVEHQFILASSDSVNEDDCLYLHIKLNQNAGFFKRLKTAFLYLLGKKSIYGDFDEVIINKATAEKLINSLSKFTSQFE